MSNSRTANWWTSTEAWGLRDESRESRVESRELRVAVLQGVQLPSHVTPDMVHSEALYADEAMLVAELNARGARAKQLPWKGNGSDWGAYDAAVIRATFDYIDDRDGFLGTLAAMEAAGCRVFNPLEVVRWNSDKRYLLEIASKGIATVPTWLAGCDAPDAIRGSLEELGAEEALLKPAVGAGGAGVRRVAVREVELHGDALAVSDRFACRWSPQPTRLSGPAD